MEKTIWRESSSVHCIRGLLGLGLFALVLAACGEKERPAAEVNSKSDAVPAVIGAGALYAWLQYGSHGLEARAIVPQGTQCPAAIVDGAQKSMSVRAAAAGTDFPVASCSVSLPATAKSVSVGGVAMPVPGAAPRHILVLGDTGCRMTNGWYENCDGKGTGVAWSFPAAARAAAAEEPDLIVHVGDYVYREAPCDESKQPGCAGSPYGDTWATWESDFFAPSRPLLDVAPWIVTRGNHENCDRNHLGWLRFLDGRALNKSELTSAGCPRFSDPYKVAFEEIDFLVLNTTTDAGKPGAVTRYADDFTAAAALVDPGRNAWTVTHRPFWALAPDWRDPLQLSAVDMNLQAAIAQMPGGAWPPEVEMALAGHIHLLETLSFPDGRPHQVVSGDAGTAQDSAITAAAIAKNPQAFAALGLTPGDFESYHDFGYVLLDADAGGGWLVTVKDLASDVLEQFHLE